MKRSNRDPWADLMASFPANAHDALPIRSHLRKPARWEMVFYTVTALLWCAALVLAIMSKYGSYTALMIGIFVSCLRYYIYEIRRKARCSVSLLGKVESFTRRRFGQKKEYPVVRFEVDGQTYHAHGQKAFHMSALNNDEWVLYNPKNPNDNCVAMDSKPTVALWMTVISGALSVALLFLEILS